MCGRYTVFNEREIEDLEEILAQIDKELSPTPSVQAEEMHQRDVGLSNQAMVHQSRDVVPSDRALIVLPNQSTQSTQLTQPKQMLRPAYGTWGFPPLENGRLIINARVETVAEKQMFRTAFANRRVLVPAAGFYEWDSRRNRHLFLPQDETLLFMAGICTSFAGGDHFVILTRPADDVMLPVHDRMPLLVPRTQLYDWLIYNPQGLLHAQKTVPLTRREPEEEQLSMF